MVFMHASEIKRRIDEDCLVDIPEGFNLHLTPNGVDVHCCAIIEIIDGGKLAVDKSKNLKPVLGNAFVIEGFEDRLNNLELKEIKVMKKGTGIRLNKLSSYFIITAEIFNFPPNYMGVAKGRTSMFRLAQTIVEVTFSEAGYKGFLTCMIVPYTNSEIELGVRFMQMAFSQLSGEGNYEEQKETNWQGGKVI